MDTVFANVEPTNWHVELEQGITEFYVDANYATVDPFDTSSQHRTNWLAIKNRPGRHWTWTPTLLLSTQLTCRTNRLARASPNFTWTPTLPTSNQSTHQTHIKPIDWQLELDRDVTERGRHLCHYCTNWHIEPIDWQIELGQGAVETSRGRCLCQCWTNFLSVELDAGITEFYMDANFATVDQSTHWTNIKPIDWQLELDQDITERGCHFWQSRTNQHVAPINWQVELDQGVTEFHVEAIFATV